MGRDAKLHVRRLAKYDDSRTPVQRALELQLLPDDYAIVESVLAHRDGARGPEFLVHWRDFGDDADQWLPYAELKRVDVVLEYMEANGIAAPSKAAATRKR